MYDNYTCYYYCLLLLYRDAVCIFYLVLRSLDTVEDDVTIPADVKSTMLTNFHTYLLDPDWKYMESKEKDRIVLEDFPVVCCLFCIVRFVKRNFLLWCMMVDGNWLHESDSADTALFIVCYVVVIAVAAAVVNDEFV